MPAPRSFTYELMDPRDLLRSVQRKLEHQDDPWKEIAGMMPDGQVEYRPLRANPMRSGYRYIYQKAGLNLNLYFPEKIFNRLHELLNRERVPMLKAAVQDSLPQRSGYVIREFKILGLIDTAIEGSDEPEPDTP